MISTPTIDTRDHMAFIGFLFDQPEQWFQRVGETEVQNRNGRTHRAGVWQGNCLDCQKPFTQISRGISKDVSRNAVRRCGPCIVIRRKAAGFIPKRRRNGIPIPHPETPVTHPEISTRTPPTTQPNTHMPASIQAQAASRGPLSQPSHRPPKPPGDSDDGFFSQG